MAVSYQSTKSITPSSYSALYGPGEKAGEPTCMAPRPTRTAASVQLALPPSRHGKDTAHGVGQCPRWCAMVDEGQCAAHAALHRFDELLVLAVGSFPHSRKPLELIVHALCVYGSRRRCVTTLKESPEWADRRDNQHSVPQHVVPAARRSRSTWGSRHACVRCAMK